MAGLRTWICQRLTLARDGLINLLGGTTKEDLRGLAWTWQLDFNRHEQQWQKERMTEAAHTYRRTKSLATYHAFDKAVSFNPHKKPRSKVLQFIIDLNTTDRWLAVPVGA